MTRKLAVALIGLLAACSSQQERAAAPPAPPPGPARGTNEWKIQNAMSAAPAEIASGAAIMDYPDAQGHMAQLRAGTNGWTCLPDLPSSPSNDPICVDGQWMDWFGQWMGHKPPKTTGVGVAYMLQGADDASNTDPFKDKPDSGQQWVHSGPHTMIIAPNAAHAFGNYPTTPTAGKPFVMFPNTPYAHLMVPAGGASHAM